MIHSRSLAFVVALVLTVIQVQEEAHVAASAFVQPKAAPTKSAVVPPPTLYKPIDVAHRQTSTSLSGWESSLAEAPIYSEGLTFGWVVICAAMTPYIAQLFSSKPLGFFLANYYGGNDIDELQEDGLSEEEISQIVESGRVAEIKWKVRFAALGLAITTIAFFEVNGGVDAVRVLRDSYIAWGVFYIEATRLIRVQALQEPPIFKKDSRLGVQAWHILVTILLWSSISETYTGNAIRRFVTEIFTFN